ncbi:Lrp/AsnC family transcriptional regulator [Halocynthiibacter namhaensis]|uniref:Lrp/AsnC family transcriptional regulator n=1 Tax=Halocynthiibacter namhaensis TaxID=1290553 RepID=UPI0005794CFE|nr:Lrp/AsnC family transcriptional regulator [Halocynthiibacter namhaensis]
MAHEKTDNLQPAMREERRFDAIDRKISAALVQNANRSFASLSEEIGLSPAALHERVKRLRANGLIKSTQVALDGPGIGKPLLAFVHVTAAGWGITPDMIMISRLPEVEEVHTVTGDISVILKVRVANSNALEGFLGRLYALKEVRATSSHVVLTTHQERPIQAEITEDLRAVDPANIMPMV